ncbi:MAG: hypothetical protein IPG55_20885 [Saprospiraceae bacterium]|nr:hypothetical protein [Candidatus Defluviibacterium haderslevense]
MGLQIIIKDWQWQMLFVLAMAMAETTGGTGAGSAGLMIMEGGVASLVIPDLAKFLLFYLKTAGATMALAGGAMAAHGSMLLKMAKDNQENKNGYREIPKREKEKIATRIQIYNSIK